MVFVVDILCTGLGRELLFYYQINFIDITILLSAIAFFIVFNNYVIPNNNGY